MIDPSAAKSREQIEQDARVGGRGEGRDHRTGERVPQLGRRRTNTDGEREMVDVVEIAGGDRGDQRGDQLVERTGIERGPSVDRFARGLVLRGELREPLARRHPLIGRDVRDERGAGEQLERCVQHERIGRRHLRDRDHLGHGRGRDDDRTTKLRQRGSSTAS